MKVCGSQIGWGVGESSSENAAYFYARATRMHEISSLTFASAPTAFIVAFRSEDLRGEAELAHSFSFYRLEAAREATRNQPYSKN